MNRLKAAGAKKGRGELAFVRGTWPFYWLSRAAWRYQEQLGAGLKSIGLDVSYWRVLICLSEDERIGLSQLAELAIVKLPTMMKIVQRMEALDLLRIVRHATDGRVTQACLTAHGLSMREAALEVVSGIYQRSFVRLSATARLRLGHDLRSLAEALEDDPSGS